jgi:hypothetical protein
MGPLREASSQKRKYKRDMRHKIKKLCHNPRDSSISTRPEEEAGERAAMRKRKMFE